MAVEASKPHVVVLENVDTIETQADEGELLDKGVAIFDDI